MSRGKPGDFTMSIPRTTVHLSVLSLLAGAALAAERG